MPTWPYVEDKKLPADLLNVNNGKLPNNLLSALSRDVISTKKWDEYNHKGSPGNYPLWTGHKLAVAAVETMIKAAAVDNIDIRVTGGYRNYSQQLTFFQQRYTNKRPNEKTWNKQAKASGKGHRKLDEYSKFWNGKRYWIKQGSFDGVSVPGSSNHGLGIAFDLEFGFDKYEAANNAIEWVKSNGFAFGFYWDTGSTGDPGFENWHLTYCFGDDYGCLPLINNSIIPPVLPKLVPPSVSRRVGNLRNLSKMSLTPNRPTDPIFKTNWRWWVPQPIDWFDTKKTNTLIPFNGFPVNPPSALKP